jgi:hypothetical protein
MKILLMILAFFVFNAHYRLISDHHGLAIFVLCVFIAMAILERAISRVIVDGAPLFTFATFLMILGLWWRRKQPQKGL